MLKAVVFDLDNTLYDYDSAHAAAWQVQAAFVQRELGLSEARFRALHSEAFRLQIERCGEVGAIHNRLIRSQLILEAVHRPIALAPQMADVYWNAFMEHMQPFADAADTLDALRALGIRVGIGTNMTADRQFDKLKKLGLMERIDFMVTSEEAGAEKPSAKLFALCVEKAGCAAGECAFVGDSLEKDALGACRAGLRGLWLRRDPDQAVPQGVEALNALSELPDRIASM